MFEDNALYVLLGTRDVDARLFFGVYFIGYYFSLLRLLACSSLEIYVDKKYFLTPYSVPNESFSGACFRF